jgi:hypothetical protein
MYIKTLHIPWRHCSFLSLPHHRHELLVRDWRWCSNMLTRGLLCHQAFTIRKCTTELQWCVRCCAPPPPSVHKDYAIVSVAPLPNNPFQFSTVHEVVEEFLVENMHVGIRDVQSMHLGQVLVQFENIFIGTC